jgi:hypothetical protein
MPSRAFLAKLTLRRLKRGVFRSVDDLKATINRFIADTNADPKPLVWTADPTVLAVKRGKQALESFTRCDWDLAPGARSAPHRTAVCRLVLKRARRAKQMQDLVPWPMTP